MENEELEKLKAALNISDGGMQGSEEKQSKAVRGESDPNLSEIKSECTSTKPKMPVYIGTKIVQAIPMTQEDFLKRQGKWQVNQETYGGGYFVKYDDGYESWSPKDVFERCYRTLSPSEISMVY